MDSLPQNDSDFNPDESLLRAWYLKQVSLCTRCRKRLRLVDNPLCPHCIQVKEASPKRAASNRRSYLKRAYRLDAGEYELMFFRQGGVCAVCMQPEPIIESSTGQPRNLSVDHNHETGEVRELLCSTCNTLLGFLEKDRDRVKKLVRYLKKHDM